MDEYPKCDCGEYNGLAMFEDRMWCPKCLWAEILYLRGVLKDFGIKQEGTK
ncbi:hypothetical protein LCGC14_0249800 [marine sediment metagenome]|uniref:Uncharacterized protein n=1 Tax=marine sediment metagenome TaxID=412755 RepID=A0A0F9ULT0_9ZZZZ